MEDLKTGRYLGDGVYASWDGMHIVLELKCQFTEAGEIPRIALEHSVWQELVQFHTDLVSHIDELNQADEADAAADLRVTIEEAQENGAPF
jgi:hypothetical protein